MTFEPSEKDIQRNILLAETGKALDIPLFILDGEIKKRFIKDAVKKVYQKTDKYKDYQKVYKKVYQKTDKYKDYQKVYQKTDKYKDYQKAYYQRKKAERLNK